MATTILTGVIVAIMWLGFGDHLEAWSKMAGSVVREFVVSHLEVAE